MSIHEDELPVGLPRPEGAIERPPENGNGFAGHDSDEPVLPPLSQPVRQRHGPEPATAPPEEASMKKDREFLENGPFFTVVPELEPRPPYMGWPGLRYKYFWKAVGKDGHWPKMSKANRIDYEIGYLEARLRQLANTTQITFGVHNCIGGSGKSTTAIYLATIIFRVTAAMTYAMSATGNLRTAALAKYAGVESEDVEDRQAKRVREIAQMSKRDIDLRSVGKMVRRSRYGVRVVAEDRPKTLEKSGGFKTPQFSKVADALHSVSELVIFDCGNDDVEPDSIPLEVARRNDVLVLAANAESLLSLENLAEELSIYSSDESPDSVPPSSGAHRAGAQISTREKAERAVVVFTNAAPSQRAEDFAAKYLPADFRGVALTVPKDYYIHPKDPTEGSAGSEHVNPADPFRIDKYTTYRAFLEAAVAVFEMAARLQGVRLPEPPFVAA